MPKKRVVELLNKSSFTKDEYLSVFTFFNENIDNNEIMDSFIDFAYQNRMRFDDEIFILVEELCEKIISGYLSEDIKVGACHILANYYYFSAQYQECVDICFKCRTYNSRRKMLKYIVESYLFTTYNALKMYDESIKIAHYIQSRITKEQVMANFGTLFSRGLTEVFICKNDFENAKIKLSMYNAIIEAKDAPFEEDTKRLFRIYEIAFYFQFEFSKISELKKEESIKNYEALLEHSETYSHSIRLHVLIINKLIEEEYYDVAIKFCNRYFQIFNLNRMDLCYIYGLLNKLYTITNNPLVEVNKREYLLELEKKHNKSTQMMVNNLLSSINYLELSGKYLILENQVLLDTLTKCKNRNALIRFLKNNEKNSKLKMIAFFDLDKLKVINDVYGHHIGDLYIQRFAQDLSVVFTGFDVYRYGGDEFVLIFDATLSKEDIFIKLNQMIEDASSPRIYKNQVFKYRFSCGIVRITESHNLDYYVKKADALMYKIKYQDDKWFEITE